MPLLCITAKARTGSTLSGASRAVIRCDGFVVFTEQTCELSRVTDRRLLLLFGPLLTVPASPLFHSPSPG